MRKFVYLISGLCIATHLFGCSKDDAPPVPVVPPADTTLPYYSDTIRKDGLTLIFKDKSAGMDRDLRKKMIDVFFTNYPKLLKDFNPAAAKTVYFTIDPAYSGVAATSGGKVTYSAGYFAGNPKDIDVVTHEIMHIIQAYSNGDPSWVTEGIADYVRFKYGIDNAGAGWSLPAYNSSQSYTNSYRITARFFQWLEVKVKPGIVKSIDASMRNGTYSYSAGFWTSQTGKTVDVLWHDYSLDPSL